MNDELMMKQLVEQMQITEQLKSANQMEWVQRMNSAHGIAEETILSELVFESI